MGRPRAAGRRRQNHSTIRKKSSVYAWLIPPPMLQFHRKEEECDEVTKEAEIQSGMAADTLIIRGMSMYGHRSIRGPCETRFESIASLWSATSDDFSMLVKSSTTSMGTRPTIELKIWLCSAATPSMSPHTQTSASRIFHALFRLPVVVAAATSPRTRAAAGTYASDAGTIRDTMRESASIADRCFSRKRSGPGSVIGNALRAVGATVNSTKRRGLASLTCPTPAAIRDTA